jgi:hypothetical protein
LLHGLAEIVPIMSIQAPKSAPVNGLSADVPDFAISGAVFYGRFTT